MLKQLLQFRTLLIALLVMAGAGNGWAEETTVTASKISSSSETWTGTANEFWDVSVVGGATGQNATNSYAQVGSKNSPSTSITFSTSGITGTITSIVVDCAAYQGRATISATVGSSAFGVQQQTVPTWSNNSGSGVTFSGNASGSIVITMTNGTGGRAMYIKSIKVTYTPAAALEKTDPTIKFNAGSVRVGRTLDLSTLFTSTSTGDVTYSISEGDTYASLSGSVLTGKEAGTVTVKAVQAETTTYKAGEATATITVNAAPTLSSIAVTTPPTKTTYSEGETFNPEGMVVTATYSDNSTDDVTSFCTFTPSDALTTSINEITVSYTEGGTTKTATQSITVNPYVQPTEISFPLNNTGFGTSYNGSVSGITDDDPITNTINNLTVTYAGSGNHYLNDTQIRLYPNNKLTFEAPSGYEITKIVLIPFSNGTWTATISSNPGSYDTSIKTWTGSASLVEFSGGSGSGVRCDIASATVTLAVQKTTSDLSVTTTSPVALDITSANIHPTSTITYTTSSTGTVTFKSDDTSVATVSSTGVITAQGEGTATITISQAADDTHKAGEQTVTVNVTDNRSAVVTNIDLHTAQKTLSVGDHGDFDPTATEADDFTGIVSYSFVTSDANVVNVDGKTFSAVAPGTATITITAMPTGGNYVNYKSATQDVDVTVKGETTLQLNTSSVNTPYGTNATVNATVSSGYDGTLTAESSNDSIATASVEGITITITPVAVGTATITVTAPATNTFSGTATETITVTVKAPEVKTKAAVNGYGKVTSTSDLESGEYLIVYEAGNVAFNGGLETLDGVSNTVPVTISNNVIAISETVDAATFTIDVAAGTIKSASGMYIGVSSNSNGLNQSEDASTYTNSFSIDEDGNAVISAVFSGSTMSLRYNNASNQTRFRYYKSGQAPIALYKRTSLTATLNGSGYATYCSEYPLDFSNAKGYSAWQVKGVVGNAITFEKVTGSVKGGTGLLLMGEHDATVTLTSENSTNELGDNLLKGTLAPTYVEANEYYGLSGQQFLKVNPGTVPAGKALLPVVDNVGNVRTLSLVFVDPTTGIAETKTMEAEEGIYNLQGQRIGKAQRGVNIIGGKKVLVK